MKALAFDENILTNIEKIDEQHKHLISVINSFLKAIDDKLPIPELERALDQIIFYSSFHFSHEEELMGEYNCPLINLAK
ncbi:MAG: hemerythrin family protein [Spirochaetes bacterium]|nr:hemerythrin family protein [Spirochaetota bacterium]